MALLPIVLYPDQRLKTKSDPVAEVNDDVRTLAVNMLETMYYEEGIGLAAVQVGVLKRLLVADVEWKRAAEGGIAEPGKQWVLINPEIIENAPEKNTYKEGCLSFPEQYADVVRPKSVRVKFQDLTGAWREESFEGLLATCIQHEIDHLNGIVFPDRTSAMKRDMLLRKAKKIKAAIEDYDHDHDHVHDENCGHGHHHHEHEHEHVHGPDCKH